MTNKQRRKFSSTSEYTLELNDFVAASGSPWAELENIKGSEKFVDRFNDIRQRLAREDHDDNDANDNGKPADNGLDQSPKPKKKRKTNYKSRKSVIPTLFSMPVKMHPSHQMTRENHRNRRKGGKQDATGVVPRPIEELQNNILNPYERPLHQIPPPPPCSSPQSRFEHFISPAQTSMSGVNRR
ncbi:hypothetical protein Bbelb_051410 [Branchiostoma belcheri]|nr:hypothetical protein Bbelb_051410 [Branchiostoma belcheri]